MRSLTRAITFAFIYLVFTSSNCSHWINEHEAIKLNVIQKNSSAFKDFLGVNAFEWDFLGNRNSSVDPALVKIMQSFGAFRHYMDWERIEAKKGEYYFNPTRSGGFNYDAVYQACKDNGIEVLACMKGCPPWLLDTYPKDQRDGENVTAPFGSDRSKPASYIDQARAAFQYAARYGNNKNVDNSLVFYEHARDNSVVVKPIVGLGYVHYMECNNEVDRTWKGAKAHQTPQEYAANLSAFYDGDMGKLGKNAGVKNADPTMKVVMAGLAAPDADYVVKMIEWCKQHRGCKPDGTINLCFDIINYHFYNNDAAPGHDNRTTGKAPELSLGGKYADDFVAMSKKYANNMDVWITEAGYDINPGSPQRAIKIGNKSALITQADWMLRSSFLYARHGLKSAYYYMLDDAAANQPGPYATSGFVDNSKKRPAADYFLQAKKLLGDYKYEQTISSDPMVDVYKNGSKKIYVLWIPDEVGRQAIYALNLNGITSAKTHRLVVGADDMKTENLVVKNGMLKLQVTETPVFVEVN
jgi:hypothetical protein